MCEYEVLKNNEPNKCKITHGICDKELCKVEGTKSNYGVEKDERSN